MQKDEAGFSRFARFANCKREAVERHFADLNHDRL
jgi:hypothetical protein